MANNKYYSKKAKRRLKKFEHIRHKIEVGKQLHDQFKESVINAQSKAAAEKESQIIESLMKDKVDNKGNIIIKGMSYEEARQFVLNNYKLEEKKKQKKKKKQEKQKKKIN